MRASTPFQHFDRYKPLDGRNATVYCAASQCPKRKESEPAISMQAHEFIDAKAAAIWLGIPLRSFHQYVKKGELPSYKLGRHRLFRRKELLAALSSSRTASRNEVLF